MKKTKTKKELTPEQKKRRKRRRIILLSIVGALIIFRFFLPSIVLRYVNKKLANLEEYYGHIEDIDIHLYRGAYVINEMKLLKKDKKVNDTIPFFIAPKIDLSIEWGALFKGRVVGAIELEKPELSFVRGAHKGEDVKADTADFRQLLRDLIPLTVDRFEISDGKIHYIDLNTDPQIHVFMQNIDASGTNISNVEGKDDLLPATLTGTGDAYEGRFSLNMKYDPLAKQPMFDLSAEMEGMNLVLVNDLLRAYGNFDVKEGTFGLYAEFATKEGEFGGYVKPIIKDLNLVQWNEEEGDVPQILWESLVGFGAEVFQNQSREQLAAKIPINGTFSEPDVDIWQAMGYLVKNAFIQALKPTVDHTINIHKMEAEKSIFKKIFGKDDKPKKN